VLAEATFAEIIFDQLAMQAYSEFSWRCLRRRSGQRIEIIGRSFETFHFESDMVETFLTSLGPRLVEACGIGPADDDAGQNDPFVGLDA
jgi:hypothetical protein